MQPAAYIDICALLVPKEMKLVHSAGLGLTDEQLDQAIVAIEAMLVAQAENAKASKGRRTIRHPGLDRIGTISSQAVQLSYSARSPSAAFCEIVSFGSLQNAEAAPSIQQTLSARSGGGLRQTGGRQLTTPVAAGNQLTVGTGAD